MKKRPNKFYTDFEFFIAEVTKELCRQERLSSSWLRAIGAVLGVHVLAKILLNDLKVSMPIVMPGIASISTGYKIQAAVEKSIEQYNRDATKYNEEEERQRIKKAQVIFHELARNQFNEDRIELLFDDFLSEEEIIY